MPGENSQAARDVREQAAHKLFEQSLQEQSGKRVQDIWAATSPSGRYIVVSVRYFRPVGIGSSGNSTRAAVYEVRQGAPALSFFRDFEDGWYESVVDDEGCLLTLADTEYGTLWMSWDVGKCHARGWIFDHLWRAEFREGELICEGGFMRVALDPGSTTGQRVSRIVGLQADIQFKGSLTEVIWKLPPLDTPGRSALVAHLEEVQRLLRGLGPGEGADRIARQYFAHYADSALEALRSPGWEPGKGPAELTAVLAFARELGIVARQ